MRSLAFSPDGQQIACGTKLGRVFLIDRQQESASAQQLRPDFSAEVQRIEFAGDGAMVARSKDHKIRVWRAPGTEPITLDGAYIDFAVAPNQRRLALCATRGQLAMVELHQIQPASFAEGVFPLPNGVVRLSFSASGRCLALTASWGREVYLLDVLDRRVIKRMATKDKSGQGLAESTVALNHDGSLLLTVNNANDTVHLWDTISETQIAGCLNVTGGRRLRAIRGAHWPQLGSTGIRKHPMRA